MEGLGLEAMTRLSGFCIEAYIVTGSICYSLVFWKIPKTLF